MNDLIESANFAQFEKTCMNKCGDTLSGSEGVTFTKLGKGYFATIYKYFSPSYNKYLALKKCDDKEMAKFEYDILSKLSRYADEDLDAYSSAEERPRIVRECIPRTYFYSGTMFTMDLIKGATLFDIMENSIQTETDYLNEKTLRTLTKKMLMVLSFMHRHNIFHRDIKPENIMIYINENDNDEDNIYPKLIDYGLSSIFEEGSKITPFAGTPLYTAPEMLMSVATRNRETLGKADVWSLGMVLAEFICKKHPIESFHFDTIKQARAELYNRVWKFQLDLPIEDHFLKNCIKSMVIFSYTSRPSAQQLLEDFE